MWRILSGQAWLRVLAALPIVTLAAVVRLVALQNLETRSPFLTFYPAVMIAALYGGLAGGLLAMALSVCLSSYLLIVPIGSFRIESKEDFLVMLTFAVSSVMMSVITEAMHRAKARLMENEKREALREREERNRLLFETMVCGIIYHDSDGVVRSANQMADSILGRPAAEVIGNTATGPSNELVREDGAPFPPEEFPSMIALRTGREVHDVTVGIFNPRDKEYRWIRVDAVPLFRGNEKSPHEVYTVLTDLTERRRAQESVKRNESLLRNVLDILPVGVWILDKSGTIISGNPEALKIWGGARYVGMENVDVYKAWWYGTGERIKAEEWASTRAIRNGDTVFNELIDIETFDGVRKILINDGIPIRDGKGEITGAIIVNQDITDRKRAEAEIERLNTDLSARAAELEAANQELEAFTYSVSHDLRTPLAVIRGYIPLIRQRCGENLVEACKSYHDEIAKGAERMAQLIDALLNFSRVARSELRREVVDLGSMAKEIMGELMQFTPERRTTLKIDEEVEANGDGSLLHIVLENLLGNAWKYTSRQEEAVIEFGVVTTGGKSVYFVRDNGPGFDMAEVEKLFLPFQRLTNTANFAGHGIGLATVERVIRRHGGRIWAEGEQGKGATFYFTLPDYRRQS